MRTRTEPPSADNVESCRLSVPPCIFVEPPKMTIRHSLSRMMWEQIVMSMTDVPTCEGFVDMTGYVSLCPKLTAALSHQGCPGHSSCDHGTTSRLLSVRRLCCTRFRDHLVSRQRYFTRSIPYMGPRWPQMAGCRVPRVNPTHSH